MCVCVCVCVCVCLCACVCEGVCKCTRWNIKLNIIINKIELEKKNSSWNIGFYKITSHPLTKSHICEIKELWCSSYKMLTTFGQTILLHKLFGLATNKSITIQVCLHTFLIYFVRRATLRKNVYLITPPILMMYTSFRIYYIKLST